MSGEQLFVGGMLSVTFRQLQVKEIVELTAKAGLRLIEWGSDVHVPPGESGIARDTARMTAEAGLQVSGYASYYRVGDEPEGEFDRVLESALHLGAPSIRVWAGRVGSAQADEELRGRTVEDARRIAERAAAHGLTVDFEFHNNTLTDTVDSTVQLMEQIASPHVRSCWQAALDETPEIRSEGLRRILPWLSTVHVFHMVARERLLLQEGVDEWRSYLDIMRPLRQRRAVLLEFVRNNEPEQFLRDAAALNGLLESVNRSG
ncbi:TIM barrel protein [Paenibacillus mesophilus]|uniref:sugar phosphate isomerase/epimerase family protein n=1 Tax=Paenibacillus mesophilus TaxID=2582849 RepID=UPI00110E559D|nr:TIM barrel protein [Paenibacillus mesophilus]TMV46826.1 TIM barrel protein [Paenibacillus mesophilus]